MPTWCDPCPVNRNAACFLLPTFQRRRWKNNTSNSRAGNMEPTSSEWVHLINDCPTFPTAAALGSDGSSTSLLLRPAGIGLDLIGKGHDEKANQPACTKKGGPTWWKFLKLDIHLETGLMATGVPCQWRRACLGQFVFPQHVADLVSLNVKTHLENEMWHRPLPAS